MYFKFEYCVWYNFSILYFKIDKDIMCSVDIIENVKSIYSYFKLRD